MGTDYCEDDWYLHYLCEIKGALTDVEKNCTLLHFTAIQFGNPLIRSTTKK